MCTLYPALLYYELKLSKALKAVNSKTFQYAIQLHTNKTIATIMISYSTITLSMSVEIYCLKLQKYWDWFLLDLMYLAVCNKLAILQISLLIMISKATGQVVSHWTEWLVINKTLAMEVVAQRYNPKKVWILKVMTHPSFQSQSKFSFLDQGDYKTVKGY